MMGFERILIVGCGNMGGAMLAGWLRGGFDPGRFHVVDPALTEAPDGVALSRELPNGRFDAVLLGIKPQMLAAVASDLASLTEGAAALSLLAGVELATLARSLPGAGCHVRVMPNLAAALGKAAIALATEAPDAALRDGVKALMAPLGLCEWVAEAQFDLLTALAGSGPAFVYRYIAALADGAAALGLEPAQAQRFAVAMTGGAAALAAESPESPRELARRVASPGGTTEAGLAVLDAGAALELLVAATLRAARDRGAELAGATR